MKVIVEHKVDYKIVCGSTDDLGNFQEKVKSELNDGWRPCGGPFAFGSTICQAVTRAKQGEISSVKTSP